MQSNKKNILLIGIGGRARDVIIPAITKLDQQYQIVNVVAQSERLVRLDYLNKEFQTITDYKLVDFSTVDLIIVAVKNSAVPTVIKKLSKFNISSKTIMLDTPVWPYQKLGSLGLLKKFRRVIISEDSFFIDFYKKIYEDIQSGVFGSLKRIVFNQSGYRYHALAVLRMFTGEKSFTKIKTIKQPNGGIRKHIVLPNNVLAEIIEPRDYSVGTLTIEGIKGSKSYQLANCPEMNQMKITAFTKLLTQELPLDYEPLDAIYDNIILKINDKLGIFYDLKVGKKSIVYYVLLLISKLASSR